MFQGYKGLGIHFKKSFIEVVIYFLASILALVRPLVISMVCVAS